ncbi:MAG: hypothetical protein CSA55_05965 [Ilumatobacter coccineus]|uniref:UPF0434 protein CSA55_05965 n=1 Tax=Ilumatobacter coccineus TaxID=467094 RepID=A0A2G6K6P8_9ACTN|nr:MAG: hypothetical protein CSA55_05965 [Ilumatobacter coccineus]
MTISPTLLSLLACPADHGPLYYVVADDLLYNPRRRCVYEVRDGIPVMLVEESKIIDDKRAGELDQMIERGEITPTFGS